MKKIGSLIAVIAKVSTFYISLLFLDFFLLLVYTFHIYDRGIVQLKLSAM